MDKRKKKRYPVFLRVFFPEYKIWGYTVNMSSDGCHIRVPIPSSPGFVTGFLIELPVIGVIPLKGYVQHIEGEKKDMGIELVQIKFDMEQSDYYSIYEQFIENLKAFEKIHDQYLSMAESGTIKVCAFPEEYNLETLEAVGNKT